MRQRDKQQMLDLIRIVSAYSWQPYGNLPPRSIDVADSSDPMASDHLSKLDCVFRDSCDLTNDADFSRQIHVKNQTWCAGPQETSDQTTR
eukprot:732091-Prorocentrum_minimum.AAC.1